MERSPMSSLFIGPNSTDIYRSLFLFDPLKDFIGNVSESSILGVYGKRKELTYGKKRVLKLSAKDKRLQASAKNRLQFLKEKDIVKKRKKKLTHTIYSRSSFSLKWRDS